VPSADKRAFVALALTSSLALAAAEGPGVTQRIQAARTTGPIRLDGKLDDPAWSQAPVFDGFVQSFPQQGAPPTERTELRVLYDRDTLYVGIVCYDSRPDLVMRQLGRRDRIPPSDVIGIAIDSNHDHQSALVFVVNAAGVLKDSLFYQDTQSSDDWDAVWEAEVAPREDGWSAEFAIPMHLFRFPSAPLQTWGFFVRRELGRRREVIDSVLIPRNANGFVSRFGHLTGVEGITSHRDVELLPYLASRATLRPQFSDASVPHPRLLDPSLDLGLDFKAVLTSSLTLNGTFNPDFGQVEADQVILNLSNVEQFFPEKRPFFTHGLDLFQPLGVEDGRSPQMMFYSRRIGLTTPILAAAKLTGSIAEGLDIGVLDAFVAGSSSVGADEAAPDRRLEYSIARPLRLAFRDSFPSLTPVPLNYFSAVARKRVAGNSTLGATLSLATPIAPRCTNQKAELGDALRPKTCDVVAGNASAIDWNLRTANGEWVLLGQADASQVVGGAPGRVLRDGTQLYPGNKGYGTYLIAGKLGGEPLRFDLRYEYQTPKLELNAIGFQPYQNLQWARANLGYARPTGFGGLHNFFSNLSVGKGWSTDGRNIDRGYNVSFGANALLPGFHTLGLNAVYDNPRFDIREVSTTGIPFERQAVVFFGPFWQTDSNRMFSLFATFGLGWRPKLEVPAARLGYGGTLRLVARPHTNFETSLETGYDYTPYGARYVDTLAPDQFIFGLLDARVLSTVLRQQVVLSPRVTLQAYAQLFSAFGRYGQFYQARSQGGPIRIADLQPAAYDGYPSFHNSALNLNLVFRWEYRLGSTLFLVYTRSQTELPVASGTVAPATLLPSRLGAGPATDVFLLKWSYWWSL
jgi:hypothetical protein